jgi:hypothetical protein
LTPGLPTAATAQQPSPAAAAASRFDVASRCDAPATRVQPEAPRRPEVRVDVVVRHVAGVGRKRRFRKASLLVQVNIRLHVLHILTNMCKISYIFVKNESYQIFMNICKLNLAYVTSILQKNWLKMVVKKLAPPNYID